MTDRTVVYSNLAEKLAREIGHAQILFPFYLSQVTDPLQPVPEVEKATYDVVRLLLEQNLSFHILTRAGQGAVKLLKEFPALASYPYFYLSVTVEATPDTQSTTSPGAPPIGERLEGIKYATNKAIAVVGRMDPLVLGLLSTDDVLWILHALAETEVKHIVASTGTYNAHSMRRLGDAIQNSARGRFWPAVARIYDYLQGDTPGKRSFQVALRTRERFHRWLRAETEKLGMTYAVCLELPKEFDSPGLAHCEGIARNFVHVRDASGRFVPLKCSGDCLRSCPDLSSPPCGHPEFVGDYPFRWSSLKRERGQVP